MKKIIIITTFVLIGIIFITNRLEIISAINNEFRNPRDEETGNDTNVVTSQYTEMTKEEIEKIIVSKLQVKKDFIPRQQMEYIFINEANHGMDGLFIRYSLANEKEGWSDYPLRGIRLYEKKGDEYLLVYDNPNAWMCEGCNNSLHAWLEFDSDTLKIKMLYGPHQSFSEIYDFKYNKVTKHWQLVACGQRPVKKTANIYLENYNAEETKYQDGIYENMFENLNDLHNVLQQWDNPEGEELNRGYFISEADHQLNVSIENMDELIDKMAEEDYSIALACAPILQKHGNYYMSQYLLQQIISKYPNHPLEMSAQELLRNTRVEEKL